MTAERGAIVLLAAAPGADLDAVRGLLALSAPAPLHEIVQETGAGETPAARAAARRLHRHLRAHGGCIACALRADLREELAHAADAGARTVLAALPTGVAPVLALYGCDAPACTSDPRLHLARIVVAVNGSTLVDDLASEDLLVDRGYALAQDDDRELADVLIALLEDADTIVVTGPAHGRARARGTALCRALNPEACVLRADELTYADAVLTPPAPAPHSAPADAASGTFAERELLRAPGGEDVSIVRYRARRPLHPARFAALLDEPFEGVLRSFGTLWLASRPDLAIAWDQRGPYLCLEGSHHWVAADPDLLASRHPVHAAELQAQWHPYYGDRAQRLTLIGPDLNAAEIGDALDACLLSDTELAGGESAWADLPDPLPPLPVPAAEDGADADGVDGDRGRRSA